MAIDAQGITLQIAATGSPGTADTAISDIKSYSGFDGEASEIDITTLDSTAKEFRTGLDDSGNLQIEFLPDFDDAGQNALRAAADSRQVKQFVLTLTDSPATTATFNGYVKQARSLSAGVDAVVEGSASIRITGSVTWV